MQHKPKLMIMGYGRHGKDTAAEYLAYQYGFKFKSSSLAAAEAIFPLLQAMQGYRSVDEAYEHRHARWRIGPRNGPGVPIEIQMRNVWAEAIKLLCYTDKTALAKIIYADNDIYVGIRTKEEFEAIKAAGMFDIAVWVDRSLHLPPEGPGSCTVEAGMADVIIDNNGTLEDLHNNIDNFIRDTRGSHAENYLL